MTEPCQCANCRSARAMDTPVAVRCLLNRRALFTAALAPALAEVTATDATDRLTLALTRWTEARANLATLAASCEAAERALPLALARGDRPGRLRVLWLALTSAREDLAAGQRELAEAERACGVAARLQQGEP